MAPLYLTIALVIREPSNLPSALERKKTSLWFCSLKTAKLKITAALLLIKDDVGQPEVF